MIILWNSAAMTVECEVVDGEKTVHNEWQADRTLARDMLAYLRDQLAAQGKTIHDITGIGVFRGPGSFTGLRIGMTVLNTLADSLGVPIVGVAGEDWRRKARERLADGENDHVVLPEYDAPARVTTPRK